MKKTVLVVIWVLSICGAGAEGTYFPVLNILSGLVFLGSSLLLGLKLTDL